MKLATVCPCMYPDTKMIHYLMESCAKQGIELKPHGLGVVFGGWARHFISDTVPAVQDLKREGYTHILYTDGMDSIIIAPEEEIIWKYEAAGSPACLMSSDCECFPPIPDADKRFTAAEPWRYVNAGGFIAEIDYFVAMVKYLAPRYPDEGNHQAWFVQDWPIPGLVLDHKCSIFQPMDGSNKTIVIENRIVSVFSGEWPCVLHFRGGYSDPVTGRDFKIEPVWRKLYGNDVSRDTAKISS